MNVVANQDVILENEKISTEEVVAFIEAVNTSSAQTLRVLTKKPALPNYERLEWVISFKLDLSIATKLKSHKKLSEEEKQRLRYVLLDSNLSDAKLLILRRTDDYKHRIDEYIGSLQ